MSVGDIVIKDTGVSIEGEVDIEGPVTIRNRLLIRRDGGVDIESPVTIEDRLSVWGDVSGRNLTVNNLRTENIVISIPQPPHVGPAGGVTGGIHMFSTQPQLLNLMEHIKSLENRIKNLEDQARRLQR